jgi:eukaryotic-like serine/threonine-protein kinase
MSSQDPRRFRQADAVFEAALDLPENEWRSFVEQRCASDTQLRDSVLALLAASRQVHDFLSRPAIELAGSILDDTTPPLDALASRPARVGPFRIVRELGHGGMGTVFLGERDDGQFQQHVALKLIRPTGDPREHNRRFLEERRILALLAHPRIARLLDGGIDPHGQPWFAMELVEGEPIDRYCESRRLAVEARLKLFLDVCDAVQFAHQHLVIHRDLKPSNILIAADGQVKLLDFGIARLVDPLDRTEEGQSEQGFLPMTPEYAAPEQVRGQPVSTATDIYSLGILLYRLLAGRRPYKVRGLTPDELERTICEQQPAPPSATFEPHGSVRDERARRAAQYGSTPGRMLRALRGDLDAITTMASGKDPAQRYPSVQALADDIGRHLAGHPVRARRPTIAYRVQRFVRRHRVAVTVALLFGVGIASYAMTLVVQQGRIRRALEESTLATRRAEQVTDFMLGLFQAAEGGRALSDTVTARELLTRGVAQARDLSGQPEMRAQMLDVIGRLYLQLGEYDQALPLLEEGLMLRRELHGEEHADVATSLGNLAAAFDLKQDVARSVEYRRQALTLRRRISGDQDTRTLDAVWYYGQALHRAGEDSLAGPLFDEWSARIALQPRELTAARAAQLKSAATLHLYQGRPDAEWMFQDALAIERELYGPAHPLVAGTLRDYANVLYQSGRIAEAEPVLAEAVHTLRGAYPDGHPALAAGLRLWGNALQRLGRFGEAQASLAEAVVMQRRFAGENLELAMTQLDYAIALSRGDRYDEAVAVARDGTRMLRRDLGDANAMVAWAGLVLGDALRGQKEFGEAEQLLLAGYERFVRPNRMTAAWRGYALGALVRLYEAMEHQEHAARYRALLAVEETARVP